MHLGYWSLKLLLESRRTSESQSGNQKFEESNQNTVVKYLPRQHTMLKVQEDLLQWPDQSSIDVFIKKYQLSRVPNLASGWLVAS